MTSDWPWTFNGQKYPLCIKTVYIKYYPPRPKFCVSLCDQPFSRYRTFYNSIMTNMLNGKKSLPEIQNLIFHYSFNNFGKDHPWAYIWIWGSESSVHLSFETYTPKWSQNANKNCTKSKIWNFTTLLRGRRRLLEYTWSFLEFVVSFQMRYVIWIFFSHMVPC